MDRIFIDTLGIDFEPFQILHPTHDLSRCMFYQCTGQISATDSVKNFDPSLADKKFKDFFSIVKDNNPSLVVTPEYSCPWNTLIEIISNKDNFPKVGTLWALGCESITLEELKSYETATNEHVKWIYETPTANASQFFFSPLVYVFQIKSDTNDRTLCCLVQFKGHDVGGDVFERNRLIKGTKRYIIKNLNDAASIRLMGIICAESLVFNHIDELEPHHPYLLVHIQLNPKPYHPKIIKFRNEIFGSNFGKLCDVLTVNWGRGFQIANNTICKDYGGSAYLMTSVNLDKKEPNCDDAVINCNHILGTYINFSSEHKYTSYIFHPEEAVVVFDTTKVCQHYSPPENCVRTGLCTEGVYIWRDAFEKIDEVNDEFHQLYLDNGGVNLEPTKREKLISMSLGRITIDTIKFHKPIYLSREEAYPNLWHKSINLNSYYLGSDQNIKGTRFKLQESQDDDIGFCLSSFAALKSIVEDPLFTNYPEILDDYKNKKPSINLALATDNPESIKHNLIQENGHASATCVYIGPTIKLLAMKKFNELKQILNPQRLVVWYESAGKVNMIFDELPEITVTESEVEEITGDKP